MGSSAAKRGNDISQASLNESKRQYEEQQKEKNALKARNMANASSSRIGADVAYSNNVQANNNLTGGFGGGDNNFSLLNLVGDMFGDSDSKLGG